MREISSRPFSVEKGFGEIPKKEFLCVAYPTQLLSCTRLRERKKGLGLSTQEKGRRNRTKIIRISSIEIGEGAGGRDPMKTDGCGEDTQNLLSIFT